MNTLARQTLLTASILALGLSAANAAIPAGTQLPLAAADKHVFKAGETKRVRFVVTAPDDKNDTQSLRARLAGCLIEGDTAYNPRNGRLYVKKPVLTCAPDTKMGAAFLGGDIAGQLSDSGLEGIKLECPSPKECTVGNLKKGSEASFTVTETMGGGE